MVAIEMQTLNPDSRVSTATKKPVSIMPNSKIAFREQLPIPDAYHKLFETTGWNQGYRADADALEKAISSSWYVLSAYDNDDLVGFGRIISDGVLYALICDMIVIPSYQGQGIGSQILEKLIEKCHREKIRVIWLFSARGKSSFYEKFGFRERPTDAPGMQLLINPEH